MLARASVPKRYPTRDKRARASLNGGTSDNTHAPPGALERVYVLVGAAGGGV
jgi:hypothetical protein